MLSFIIMGFSYISLVAIPIMRSIICKYVLFTLGAPRVYIASHHTNNRAWIWFGGRYICWCAVFLRECAECCVCVCGRRHRDAYVCYDVIARRRRLPRARAVSRAEPKSRAHRARRQPVRARAAWKVCKIDVFIFSSFVERRRSRLAVVVRARSP